MRETTSVERIIWNTQSVIEETIECIHYAKELILNNKANDAERLFARLTIERVITNLHQLEKAYTKHTRLEFSATEKNSYDRVKVIRQALVHASTDIEAIIKENNIRGSYNIVGASCNFGEFNGIKLTNWFSDDVKIFYGKEFVLIKRDLIRLVCTVVSHYNSHTNERRKLNHRFNADVIFSLSNEEPVVKETQPA